MAYDNPTTITYHVAVSTSSLTRKIKGPSGMRGRLREEQVTTHTAAVAADATTPSFKIGTAGDDDAFATAMTFADAAAAGSNKRASAGDATIVDATMEADTDVVLTHTAGTDGSAYAFAADWYVTIDWFK